MLRSLPLFVVCARLLSQRLEHGSEGKAPRAQAQKKAEDVDPLLQKDVARIEAERRQPLPEGSKWGRDGGDEIEPLLAFIDVIDAAWLLKLANGEVMPERKGVVPAWQDVPPEAKLSLTTLRKTTMDLKLPIAVLSYGWASRGHCDPDGALLRRLKPVLQRMVHCCQHGVSPRSPDERPAAWGIIWDFLSLPQRGYTTGYNAARDDRSPYQLARFSQGLGSINVPYAAIYVTTLVCDWPMPEGAENAAPIEQRGWCIFERALSSVRKHDNCCLQLSLLEGKGAVGGCWDDLVMTCKATRAAPLPPGAFEAMLRDGMAREDAAPGTGFRFTNGKDATNICIPQYREGFLRLMGGRERGELLNFARCGWGDEEVKTLAAALACAQASRATTQARVLRLSSNKLTDAAMPQLVEAIEAGAMPELKDFHHESNEFLGDPGLAVLRPLLAGRLSGRLRRFAFGSQLTAEGARSLVALMADGHFAILTNLDLSGNRGLGDEGAGAIACALSEGLLPKLKTLYLDGTGMDDAGAAALVEALGRAPELQKLIVGRNAFGEGAKDALKAACEKRGVKAMKSYFDAL